MRKLPEKFVTAFTTMSATLGGQADLETFELICGNIHRTTAKKRDDKDSDDEVNLLAFDKKKTNNGKKCNHCGRTGQKPDNCWMLKKNKEKRPDWFDPVKYNKNNNSNDNNNNSDSNSSNNSVNNVEMGAFGRGTSGQNDGPEQLLTGLSILKNMKLLEYPNIWIADTGTTCDSTPHTKGAVNIRRNSASGVIFGDGETMTRVHLPGVITNASGNELQSVKMCSVTHVKSAKLNLFSLTKQQEDGWILHGDSDTIWLTKEDKIVVFNIKIKTSKGMVFAMNIKQKEEEQDHKEPEAEEGKELNKSSEEITNEIIELSENTSSDSRKSSGSEDSNTQESQEIHKVQANEEKPKNVHEEMTKNDRKHGIKTVAKEQELAQQMYKKRIKTCKG
jgi:hypothetical protein